MSKKLISDLSRLLRVMFVTCLIFPISTRNVEETFASFFVFLYVLFCSFILNWFGLKNACVFSKLFSLSNISFGVLKAVRFPCCRSFFWAQNWLKKAKRSPDVLYPRLRLVSLYKNRIDSIILENSRKGQNNSLPKVNTINSCSIGNASNMLSLNSNSRR